MLNGMLFGLCNIFNVQMDMIDLRYFHVQASLNPISEILTQSVLMTFHLPLAVSASDGQRAGKARHSDSRIR